MCKRTMVLRCCEGCKLETYVRKDGVGKFCRSCRAKENSKNRMFKDISNQKFGFLLVLSPYGFFNKTMRWKCKCICGNECVVCGSKLRNGTTKSCGCLSRNRKGMSSSLTYRTWKAMNQRCHDSSIAHHKNYGGKGIKVCDRWRYSFENFIEDMGFRKPGLTLDRIDGNLGYFLENCRWRSPKDQANNKKNNCYIEYEGQKKTLTQWAEEYKLNWSTLRKRIFILKWDLKESLEKPVGFYAIKKK